MSTVMRRPDVLIADDDPTAITSVRAILSDTDYAVVAASSGRAAIQAATTQRPRLMILDVGMPDLDGYDVCRMIRAHSSTVDLPIPFISASSATAARIAGLRAGAVDFIGKPFEPEELKAKVEVQLSLVAVRESLAQQNNELARANSSLRADLLAASHVQEALLPQKNFSDRRVRFGWRCVQCQQLGGDAVNVLRITKDAYAFYLLDASGHGCPASLLAMATGFCATALCENPSNPENETRAPSPASVLGTVNRTLAKSMPAGAFVTMICGVINAADRSLTIAAAGHPGPLFLRRGRPKFLDNPAPPVGLGEWTFTDHRISLAADDRLVCYSDGIYEQRNEAGDRLERSDLATWSLQHQHRRASEMVDRVMGSFEQWRGLRAIDDDVSLLVIDYAGSKQ